MSRLLLAKVKFYSNLNVIMILQKNVFCINLFSLLLGVNSKLII